MIMIEQPECVVPPIKIRAVHSKTLAYLYTKYHDKLTRNAVRKIGSVYGEDLVSETFLQLTRDVDSMPSLEEKANFLCKATRDNCSSFMKEQKRLRQFHKSYREQEVEADAFLTDDISLSLLLRNLINQLPTQRRKIITLLFYSGLSSNETAIVMNLSRQTVLNQKAKALLFLRGRCNAYLKAIGHW